MRERETIAYCLLPKDTAAPEDGAEVHLGETETASAPVAETAGQGKKRRAAVLAGDDKEKVARMWLAHWTIGNSQSRIANPEYSYPLPNINRVRECGPG